MVTESLDVFEGFGITNKRCVLTTVREPDDLKDTVELIFLVAERQASTIFLLSAVRGQRETTLAHKERSTMVLNLDHLQKLSEDTSCRPDIDLVIVVLFNQDQFWRSVPPRRHV